MKIWLPSVRSDSGSDVFVERLADLLSTAGCKVEISWFRLKHEFMPWRLRNVQPPEGTDLIHANSWSAFAFGGHGVPLVVTAHHCVRSTGYPSWKGPLRALYHNYWIGSFEKRSFACADAITGVSDSAVAEIDREFQLGGRIRVIENWLDIEQYCPSPVSYSASRRVLWVGNMSSRKGADLLQALHQRLDPSVELHIVAGRRAQSSGLERLGKNVKVWPRLSEAELIRLFQESAVTVCLSRHEGFGYTALEAMACGRPVVAFDVTGIRDVVKHNVTGLLCTVEDAQSVADACMRLVERPDVAIAMGQAGRLRAVERFGPATAASAYLDLYQRVLQAKETGRRVTSVTATVADPM